MTAKTCTKCNETKETTEFYKHTSCKDGLQSLCKPCYNAARSAYRKTPKGKAVRDRYFKKHRASLTVAERCARDNTNGARKRSDLSSSELYGGLTYTEAEQMTLPFAEERLRLEAETGVAHHIDHIIPIAAGGTHTKENLQVLTAKENYKKGKDE